MSAGLAALLDDIATIAKMAAASVDDVSAAAGKASAKAVGVVVDDAAVTPRYVQGIEPARELPIIWKIARGSIINKLVFILPVALLLSQFAPWALTPLLMLGGAYLSFEGAEKLIEKMTRREPHQAAGPVAARGAEQEKALVSGAVRTDLILSAEIMVIALNEVADQGFWLRLGSLVVVAVLITVLVYGVVGVIVKMDDIGLRMAGRRNGASRRVGAALVAAMPHVLTGLAVVGTAAMLWVGGHIIVTGLATLGWELPEHLAHGASVAVATATGPLGGVLGWLTETLCSAIVGFVVGAAIAGVIALVRRVRG